MMNRAIIWDFPIRIFHWAFAGCLAGALALAFLVDAGRPLFVWHMLLGMAACFFLVVRLVLGVMGSRHNRFKTLLVSPRETLRYIQGIITGKAPHYLIHNPASSAAALGMYAALPLLFISGLKTACESVRIIHIVLAYGMLALVLAHFAGITINIIWHRGDIAFAMITGTKPGAPDEGLASAHPLVGMVVVLISIFWMYAFFSSYNHVTGTIRLPLTGCSLQLLENRQIEPPRDKG